MVRSVTLFDEDWTEEDMGAALDWLGEQANRCAGCGLPYDETTDPAAEMRFDAELVTCHACAAKERRHRNHVSDGGDTFGLRVRVVESSSVEG